jgi:hypothetical protein
VGIDHLQRLENPLAKEFIQGLSRDYLHQPAHHVGCRAILPGISRVKVQGQLRNPPDDVGDRFSRILPRRGFEIFSLS